MKPYRVAVVAACPFPSPQGTQVYLQGLCRALLGRGHEVHLVVYGHGAAGRPVPGLRIHRTPLLPGYASLRSGPHLPKLALDALLVPLLLRVVRRHGIDLMHAHNYEAPLAAYAVRALTGRPVVYTAHNLMAAELASYSGFSAARYVAGSFGRLLDRHIPRRADFCTALSPSCAETLLRQGVDRERLAVLPPGVDRADFQVDDEELAPACPGTLPPDPVVVYAGNPDRYQELGVLYAAMARLQERLPRVRLRLVSAGALAREREAALQAGVQAERLECIETSSWDRIRALLMGSLVAVSPRSSCPGYPMKVLNYRALGLPVVACRGSAHGVDDGRTGRVIKSGDVEGFAVALEDLLRRPEEARRMGRIAQRQVFANQSWSSQMPLWERVYGQTIALAGPRPLG